MSSSFPHKHLKFGAFEFDPDRLALYSNGELLKVERRALEVLGVLIRSPKELTTTKEIIEVVWKDNPHGITPVHVAQHIRKLRVIFESVDSGREYIRTVKGSGFVFESEVDSNIEEDVDEVPTALKVENPVVFSQRGVRSYVLVGVSVLLLLTVGVYALVLMSRSDTDEVQRVVRESQHYESLVLYRNPSAFTEADLDRFWAPEADVNSSYDRNHIRTGVQKLLSDGRRYGPETKNEQFEFQSVEIDATGTTSIVKTLERWFISEYSADGKLLKNKNVGPYFVSYVVRKIDDRWLIERSSTARANPLNPTLEAIENVTTPVSGQQFFVKIIGKSFNPETVFLKVIGPGCPEVAPCSVPNSALRIHSQLSENVLENVPLTLASGEFVIFAHNGESVPSNSIKLVVP